MYSWFKYGELESEGSSITEGIGQGRVTKNIEGAPVDDAYQIPDSEALPIIFDLLEHEGLCLGGFRGIHICRPNRVPQGLRPPPTLPALPPRFRTPYHTH